MKPTLGHPTPLALDALASLPVGTIFGAAGGGIRGVGMVVAPGWITSNARDLVNREPVTNLVARLRAAGSAAYLVFPSENGAIPPKGTITRWTNAALAEGGLPPAGAVRKQIAAALDKVHEPSDLARRIVTALTPASRRSVWMARPESGGNTMDVRVREALARAWYRWLVGDLAEPWRLSRDAWIRHAAQRFDFVAEEEFDDTFGSKLVAERHLPRMREGDAVRIGAYVYRLVGGELQSVQRAFALDLAVRAVRAARDEGKPVPAEVLASWDLSPLSVEAQRRAAAQAERTRYAALQTLLDALWATPERVTLASLAGKKRWIAVVRDGSGRSTHVGFVEHAGRSRYAVGTTIFGVPGTYKAHVVTPETFRAALQAHYPYPLNTIPWTGDGMRRLLDDLGLQSP